MSSLAFTVPGKPIPQGSVRSLGKGRPSVHGNADRLLPWRDLCITIAQQQMRASGWRRITEAVIVSVNFCYERPLSHYRKDGTVKPTAPRYPISRASADIDKTCRALLDALTVAGVLADDSQVVGLHAGKHWAAPGDGPFTRAWVRPILLDTTTGTAA